MSGRTASATTAPHLGLADWDWNLQTGEARFSDGHARLLGLDPAEPRSGRAWWVDRIHPDDALRVAAAVESALRDGSRERWNLQYRVRCATNEYVEVADRGFIVRSGGVVLQALGVVEPAGLTRSADGSLFERAQDGEARFRSIVEFIPQLAWSADATGWIHYYNRRWYDYTATTLEQMEGWGWVVVHDPLDLPRLLKIWRNAITSGEPWEDEFRLRRGSDGMLRWHLSRAMPLRDANGNVVQWFGTNTDIHDQKLAAEQYSQLLAREQNARRQAEAANRAKDEFLALVSHELRAPLNVILGWSQMLLSGSPLPEEKKTAALQKIEVNARLQTKLVEDLLDVSRIITGKLQLDLVPVEVAPAVEAAAASVREKAEGKGVLLEIGALPPETRIAGDAARLQQIVRIVLENAVKFTPAGKTIRLSTSIASQQVEIAVRDEGEGFAPELVSSLFNRFRQADSGTTRKHGGLGLGLAIARELASLQGGEILAESPGPGCGATFTVRLPILRTIGIGAEAAPEPPAVVRSLAGIRILCVDDEDGAREVLSETLLGLRATVTVAGSVEDALRAFRLDRPDVVITDLGMPHADGYSLVERIRALPGEAGRTPVVALTAYASVQDRNRVMESGFDRYLTKPLDRARLSAVIAELVASRVVPA